MQRDHPPRLINAIRPVFRRRLALLANLAVLRCHEFRLDPYTHNPGFLVGV